VTVFARRGATRAQSINSGVPGLSPAARTHYQGDTIMRSILLWLLGVPIPIIILIALFSH